VNNKQILGALAMDLKRVALGYFRGSTSMTKKFSQEALRRKNELNHRNLKPYLVVFLNKIEKLEKEEKDRAADDALFYSTIFQNASMIAS
jgi:hypothetical protein